MFTRNLLGWLLPFHERRMKGNESVGEMDCWLDSLVPFPLLLTCVYFKEKGVFVKAHPPNNFVLLFRAWKKDTP